ncbi:response regulator [Parasphingorhabdus sp.]|uniref:response regulator n=1 Tax=Parasphingorhabdus sp. TaxID=2709688 RepID=UPI003593B440
MLHKMLKVLIVEDEIFVGLLLEETLQSLGYQVCAIASTEADAVLQAEKYQPDFMIVDAGLSVGSGISAIEEIQKKRNIPHIFVTGDPRKVRSRLPDAIILEKPFFIPQLIEAIARTLAISNAP